MWSLLFHAIIIGIITLVFGNIIFNLSINKKNQYNVSKPCGINLAFFMTGFIIHIVLEIVGLNKMYCDKKIKCNCQ